MRSWIVRQLVVGLVGALHGDVVEKKCGGENGFGDFGGVVGYPEVFAGGDDPGTEGALIEIVENGSADEGALAIEVDAIEQARGILSAQRFDIVDGFEAAVFGDLDEFGAVVVGDGAGTEPVADWK